MAIRGITLQTSKLTKLEIGPYFQGKKKLYSGHWIQPSTDKGHSLAGLVCFLITTKKWQIISEQALCKFKAWGQHSQHKLIEAIFPSSPLKIGKSRIEENPIPMVFGRSLFLVWILGWEMGYCQLQQSFQKKMLAWTRQVCPGMAPPSQTSPFPFSLGLYLKVKNKIIYFL